MSAIVTQKANCQDCHRCLRSCPIKAIGIEDGQARLLENKCVQCGRCVVECPQQAKQVSSHVAMVKTALAAGQKVVLSLAPSAVAAFGDIGLDKLRDKLKALGVSVVEETAVGAEVVSRYYAEMLATATAPVISACCPVIVSMIKKYYPGLVGNLAPVVSPMQAHGRLLRQRQGPDAMVVFAGPCIGKIGERDEAGSQVDAVITFEDLRQWLTAPSASSGAASAASFRQAASEARLYPVAGGILKSFTTSEYISSDIIAVDGLEKCMEVFDSLVRREIAPRFIEALACSGGCINGPVSGTEQCSPAKRLRILEFAAASTPLGPQFLPDSLCFDRVHVADPVRDLAPSEAEIRQVLARTGKFTKQDEKNCGACGFNSCREKAIAVCRGLTTTDTCVPYMRSKAESFANVIVDNSMNAIIVVNGKMEIQEFNPAAETMFGCQKEIVKGRELHDIMDCTDIIAAAGSRSKTNHRRVTLVQGPVTHQMIVPVDGQDLIIIVLTDISAQEKHSLELEEMKQQTVAKATEIINKQMHVAQEIAGLLGETTAETKAALIELVGLLKIKGED